MLRHSSDAFNLVGVGHVEGLHAGVVKDVPEFYHAFGVGCDEAVEIGEAVDADEWVLVPVKSDNWAAQVGVPDEDIEVEAARDNDFVFLTVGHFSDGSFMTDEGLDWSDCEIREDLVTHWVVLEVGLNLVLDCLLISLFLGTGLTHAGLVTLAVINLLLAQIPEVNLAIIDTSSQLVDIRQILQALYKVVHEPWRVLRPVSDILFLLLVSSLLLLDPAGAWQGWTVLIRHVVGVTDLGLVVEGEEQLDVPRKDCTLDTA